MSALMLMSMRENLECPICMDVFTTPKLLPCGHTFCEQCIRRHIYESRINGSFKCPMCQAKHKARIALTDNWILADVLDKINEIQTTSDMYSCSHCVSESAYLCEDCCELLCVACHIRHTEKGDFLNHHIVILAIDEEEKYQQINKMEYSLCKKHNGVFEKKYCKTCNLVVCSKCVVSLEHVGHRECIVSLQQLKQDLLQTCADNLRTHQRKFDSELELLETKSEEIENKRRSLMAQLRKNTEHVTRGIQRHSQEKKDMVSPVQGTVQDKLQKNRLLTQELDTLDKSAIKFSVQRLQELKVKTVALNSEAIDIDIHDVAVSAEFETEFVASYLSGKKCNVGTSVHEQDFQVKSEQHHKLEKQQYVLGGLFLNILWINGAILFCSMMGFLLIHKEQTKNGGRPQPLSQFHYFVYMLLSLIVQASCSVFLLLKDYGKVKHISWRVKYLPFLFHALFQFMLGAWNIFVGYIYFQHFYT